MACASQGHAHVRLAPPPYSPRRASASPMLYVRVCICLKMLSREASSYHIYVGDPPRRKLKEYRSREVAEELCLMDSELLRKIDTAELQNGAWMKKDKVGRLVHPLPGLVSHTGRPGFPIKIEDFARYPSS